jgi:hydroxyacylglutathione hydrolase
LPSSSKPPAAQTSFFYWETKAVGPLRCNCTLIADTQSKEAILIDPGGDEDELLSWVESLECRLIACYHTHAHFDHFLAAGWLHEQTGCTLHLHPQDFPLWAKVALQCQLFGIPEPSAPIPDPTHWLEKETPLTVGQFKGWTLFTPGHSPGSCCFHFPEAQLLLTGDTLFRGGVGRTDLWGGDWDTLNRSLKRIVKIVEDEDTEIVAGHGPNSTLKRERERNPYLSK